MSQLERDSRQLSHQKTEIKPVFRNTIPNVFARLRRYLGLFFYLRSRGLGIRQQSRSPISVSME